MLLVQLDLKNSLTSSLFLVIRLVISVELDSVSERPALSVKLTAVNL